MSKAGYQNVESLIAPLKYSIDHVVKTLAVARPSSIILITHRQPNSRVIFSYETLANISQSMGVGEARLYTIDPLNPLTILELASLIEENAPATLSLGGATRAMNIFLYTAASLVPSSIEGILLHEPSHGLVYRMPRWILSLAASNESKARLRILETIAERGEVRVAELASITGYSKATITKHVRWLNKAGLVRVSLGIAKPLVKRGSLRLERASRRQPRT